MNTVPTDGVVVDAVELRRLVEQIFIAVPIPEEHADVIAQMLVDTDLRGVVSHGVTSVERYVRVFQERTTNPNPKIKLLAEGPATAALSGAGGLGIIVAIEAMKMAIEKARVSGVGVVTTTYHDHIGSAGKYVRMALRQHLIGVTFSGRSSAPSYATDASPQASIQGSPPLAFGTPSKSNQPDFLLDFSSRLIWDEDVFAKYPELYFRGLGLGHIANLLSGTLGGQMLPEFDRDQIEYPRADQSGFFMALNIDQFVPLQAFEEDVSKLMGAVAQMEPYPGLERADLPGGPEWRKEQSYRTKGVPISGDTMSSLTRLAKEFNLKTPWTNN